GVELSGLLRRGNSGLDDVDAAAGRIGRQHDLAVDVLIEAVAGTVDVEVEPEVEVVIVVHGDEIRRHERTVAGILGCSRVRHAPRVYALQGIDARCTDTHLDLGCI